MSLWDYNAPQFVDFNASEEMYADSDLSDYFEYDHESGEYIGMIEGQGESIDESVPSESGDPGHACVTREDIRDKENVDDSTAESGESKSAKSSRTPSSDRVRGMTKEAIDVARARRTTRSRTGSLRSRTSSVSNVSEVSISSQKSAPARETSLKRSNPQRRCRSASLNESTNRLAHLKPKPMGPPKEVPRLRPTVPKTPSFMKRKPLTSSQGSSKTSEQRELEQIQALKKRAAMRRQLAEHSLQLSKASAPYQPPKASARVTRVEEFRFATDTRVKPHEVKSDCSKGFVEGLRHADGTKACKPVPRMTVPQPFKLSERKRKHEDGESGKYTSVAEEVNKFSSKTPDRFKSRPRRGVSPAKKSRPEEKHITVPKTPHFETKTRTRSTHVISQEEIEEKEVEEMKSYKFKANPINDKIFHGVVGVAKVEPKELTTSAAFDLATERRNEMWQNRKHDEEEQYEFHARPAPKAILERPAALKPVKAAPITVPESPAFALKNRVRPKIVSPEPLAEMLPPRRSQQVHHTGVPFHPHLEHRRTEPQPFSFEERDKNMMKHKEEKIHQIFEEEKKMREFRAQPLPDLAPEVMPVKPLKVTVPEPFNIETDTRGAAKAEEWSHKLEEELKKQREAAKFKARPAKVTHMDPYVPKPSERPPTVIEDFELSTDQRAEKWEQWEKFKREKEQEVLEKQQALERAKKEDEEREIQRLRQQAVHKAQPVKKYKPVQVKPSEKPLTDAKTPRFSSRIRSRTSVQL